ncbi:MAG: RNA methyltransferase [Desulfobacteraceae bacterium]|nr:MAG: RNA methyltransferase [Desulfobacteraceae bacterium]
MRLYVGLLHYPVYNKNYETIASAITTFDLHDGSRLAKTYGVKAFFVITPLADQQELARRVLRHWTVGYGAEYNWTRKEALELMAVSPSLEACVDEITSREAEKPVLIVTDASRKKAPGLTYAQAKAMVRADKVILLLFGTAWGLVDQVFDKADYLLDPVEGCTNYNHLSVRSAAAIILDRLAGRDPLES